MSKEKITSKKSLCSVGIRASQPSGDKVVCGQPSWKFLQQKSPQAKAFGQEENKEVIDVVMRNLKCNVAKASKSSSAAHTLV